MWRLVALFFALGAAIFLGMMSALWTTGLLGKPGVDFADVDVAGWQSDWSIGSDAAGPYMRARIARHGLLALTKQEAVYFTRRTDDDGRALTEECTYRLTGGRQPAEWWSITLYDSASRLPMNEDNALSLDRSQIGSVDAWGAIVSPIAATDSAFWISSRNAGEFDLMLRLYRPTQALLASPETELNTPSIERLGCQGGADE
ncbi:MAG: DUF1214 domain-containing protein [Pseudomonadota bacterium]